MEDGGGGITYPPTLILCTRFMGGGKLNLIILLLLTIPSPVDELLGTQLLSVVAFRGMSDPVGFYESARCSRGLQDGENGASVSVATVVLAAAVAATATAAAVTVPIRKGKAGKGTSSIVTEGA